jgi:hypothetical protein
MQCYDNKHAFGGFLLGVFIQNRLRSYFTLLRSFRSFRSYFTRVRLLSEKIDSVAGYPLSATRRHRMLEHSFPNPSDYWRLPQPTRCLGRLGLVSSFEFWLLLYITPTFTAGHIILTPANQLVAAACLSTPPQNPSHYWRLPLPTRCLGRLGIWGRQTTCA